MMAKVFALRHLACATGVLLFALLTVALGWISKPDQQALFLLFAVFYLLVATVLLWIRVASVSKVLLLSPLAVLLPGGWHQQLFAVWLSAILSVEAVRREARSDGGEPFLVLSLLTLGSLAPLALVVQSSALVYLAFFLSPMAAMFLGIGCWRWQNRLKYAISELD